MRRFFSCSFRTDRVLDIGGGGSGAPGALLSRRAESYAAVDIIARPSTDVVSDAHALGVRDSAATCVVMTEVLEHLHSPRKAVAELWRIVHPGGVVFVTVPQYWHVHGWPSDYYRYTCYGLESLFTSAGFEIESMEPMGGPFQLLYSVAFLNLVPWVRRPGVYVLVHCPVLWLTWKLDETFFPRPTERRNPDTRGWAMLARKPDGAGT